MTRCLSCRVTEGRSLASPSLGFFICRVDLISTHLSEASAGTVQGPACSKCSIKGNLGDALRPQWVALLRIRRPGLARAEPGRALLLPPASQGET